MVFFQAVVVAAVGDIQHADDKQIAVELLYCCNAACSLDIPTHRSTLANYSVAFPLNTCFLECSDKARTGLKVDGIACAVGMTALMWVRWAALCSDYNRGVFDDTCFAVVAVAGPCD